jgi:class 3 adenylate cyclase
MAEAVTKAAKYVFLDVLGFTQNRSVEAQTDIIGVLNSVVLDALSKHKIKDDERILLPTGDGICLALLGAENPYDIHIRIALSLIAGIEEHNSTAKDEQRRFKIRVGINSNVDNLITDVNGSGNIAGAGINLAQRVMSAADGNQILVGQPVFDTMSQREKYMYAFRPYVAVAKHGLTLQVYQLVVDGYPGLDVTTPSQFREESPANPVEERIPEIAAYYMAHAMVHRAEIVSCMDMGQSSYSLVVLLWMLAEDSLEAKHRAPHELAGSKHARKSDDGFVEQFEFYKAQDFWVCADFSQWVSHDELRSTHKYFEFAGPSFGIHFVNPEGQRKLKTDWPEIWEEFNLEAHGNLGPRDPGVPLSGQNHLSSADNAPPSSPSLPVARARRSKSKKTASKPRRQSSKTKSRDSRANS